MSGLLSTGHSRFSGIKIVIGRHLGWVALVAVSVLSAAALSSCGEGYELKPAILNVAVTTQESKQQLLAVVSRVLKSEGFEDFGRYDEMIGLIRENPAMSPKAKEAELDRLYRIGSAPFSMTRAICASCGPTSPRPSLLN